MKIKYTFLLLLSVVLVCFAACDDNENDQDKQIEIDKYSVELKLDEAQTIRIPNISDSYHVFSLNEDVASLTQLEDPTQFEVKGLRYGKTQIMVVDEDTNVKAIPVSIRDYESIKLDSEAILEFEGSFDTYTDIEINILEANGKVEVQVSDSPILYAPQFDENKFTARVSFKELNSTEVIFTDEYGLETKVTITVKNISYKPPYTEEEYQAILKDSSIRYYTEGIEDKDYLYYNGSRINITQGDVNTYGWKYVMENWWGDMEYYTKISFKGDKEVGVKTEGKIERIQGYSDSIHDLAYIEIIKVKDGKIWCIYSYIGNYGYNYGYFVDTINP